MGTDWGAIVFCAFLVIIAAAIIGLVAWAVNRASSEAYSVKMSANAPVLERLSRIGVPHNVTIYADASMSVEPLSLSSASTPQTTASVRYKVDANRPDDKERRDLLTIVRFSAQKLGPTHHAILSGDRCKREGVVEHEGIWQNAINYGKPRWGIVAIPRQSTDCGDRYPTLAQLEDAINEYETINPTAPKA